MVPADSGFLVAARGNLVVSIDPTINEELRLEGLAREIVNRIQKMRKELDLPVEARIQALITTPNTGLQEAISANQSYIEAETLSSLVDTLDGNASLSLEHDIEGETVTVALYSDAA